LLAINPQNLGGLLHFRWFRPDGDNGLPALAVNDAQAAAAEYHALGESTIWCLSRFQLA
jgi:hypothetical protein